MLLRWSGTHHGRLSSRGGGPQARRLALFTTHATLSYLDYRYRADDVLLFGRESAGVPRGGP